MSSAAKDMDSKRDSTLLDSILKDDDVDEYLILEAEGIGPEVIDKVIDADSVQILRLLWKQGKITRRSKLLQLAERAIGVSALKCLQYILIKLDAREDLSNLLLLSVTTVAFSVVLRDVRSHPELILNRVIEKMSLSTPTALVVGQLTLLVLDPRIRVEEIQSETVASLFRLMQKSSVNVNNIEVGYGLGTAIVKDYHRLTEQHLQGEDACSLLLRQIVFKRTVGLEMMRWMSEARQLELSRAAAHILSDEIPTTYCVCIVRALLLTLLYPTMKLREAIKHLENDGYEGNTLADSAGILGAYYTLVA